LPLAALVEVQTAAENMTGVLMSPNTGTFILRDDLMFKV